MDGTATGVTTTFQSPGPSSGGPLVGEPVTNAPALLCFRGEFIEETMRRERGQRGELQSAVRKKKFGSLDEVEAVVLESSDEFSVTESVDDASSFGESLDEQLEWQRLSGRSFPVG